MNKFEVGEYAECMPWKLIIPFESYYFDGMYNRLCPHIVLRGEPSPQRRYDGSVWGYRQEFTLPEGVVQCLNEGGHNFTQLCLACFDEARKSLER